jgi:cephalosporin hydroxylase
VHKDDDAEFRRARGVRVDSMLSDRDFADATDSWIREATRLDYSYNFDWLGRPIIQYPQDLLALQELIFDRAPDAIVETGVARGGSTVFFAHMLATLDLLDALRSRDPGRGIEVRPRRKVVAVDVEIRAHNRSAIEGHPLAPWLVLVEGDSRDPATISMVFDEVSSATSRMLVLDSNHTHEHVLGELTAYTPLVTRGQFAVVLDTIVEKLPEELLKGRNWGQGNSPGSAVNEFMQGETGFTRRSDIDSKLQISVAPGGYLERL